MYIYLTLRTQDYLYETITTLVHSCYYKLAYYGCNRTKWYSFRPLRSSKKRPSILCSLLTA